MKYLKQNLLWWWVISCLLFSCSTKNGTLKSGPPIEVTPTNDPKTDSTSTPKFGSPNHEYDQHKIDSIKKHQKKGR
ncbi:MAG: hypothetical protein IPM48_03960 [Saprospiraceae bacterium]|nr:hypothetical protein [Saprospiraceae bacterium]